MTRIKILVLFGGESTEHTVSIASARNVYSVLDQSVYEVTLCYIDQTGQWWLVNEIVESRPEHSTMLVPNLGLGTFTTTDNTTIPIDVIFPILHGKNGEDGSVQALAQLLHIPVVGCTMTASAVAMNKYIAKQVVAGEGVPVVPYLIHRSSEDQLDYTATTEKLGNVLFVKPANAGSSVGVTKVKDVAEFQVAIDTAHQHDDLVLIEKAIDARELEVAVLGNFPDISTSDVGEIKPEGEFYSFESKYDDGTTSQAIIPADINEALQSTIQKYAIEVFRVVGGRGLSRIDFFVDKNTDELYFNELNTIPGFTDISMYPKLWQHAGMSYADLVSRLISLALEK